MWGAVLSTIAFVWNIIREVKQRGKLRVHCYRGIIVSPGYIDEKTYLIYSITNTGKEPVTITNFGGTIKDTKYNAFCITPEAGELPKKLLQGEQVILKTDIETSKHLLDDNLLTLNATDTLNRKFNCSKKDLKKIIREQKEANQ